MIDRCDADGTALAFFYCLGTTDSYGDSSGGSGSADASYIIRSLIRQFGQTQEVFELLSAKYQSRKPGRELQLSDSKNLFYRLVETRQRASIVIDAMDECDTRSSVSGERRNLLEVFEKLLKRKLRSKYLFPVDMKMISRNTWEVGLQF